MSCATNAILVVAVAVLPMAAALQPDPEAVVFHALDQSATVTVRGDAGPVRIESVKAHELYVGENTYGYMIDVHSADGKLVIRPKDLEAGSYLLVANTDAGEVRVAVYAPLTDLPTTLEQQAALLGISVDELQKRLGIGAVVPRQEIEIDLAPVHYVGQTLQIDVPPAEQNTITWLINDQVVHQGVNAHTLNYTFEQEGVYVLAYVESRDAAVIASDTAVTRVLAQPPVVTTIAPNTEVVLRGPQDYAKHTWSLDGNPIGTDRTLRFVFPQPGEFIVENRAEEGIAGGNKFQQQRYHIIVQRP